MITDTNQIVSYYTGHSRMTDPGPYASLLDVLPSDVGELVKALQKLTVHRWWLQAYGLNIPEERANAETNLRPMVKRLARLLELDNRPLTGERSGERKLVSNCRDFTVMIVSILRHKGIAARSRCGFGAYFTPGKFEDHWVAEYWNPAQDRWVMVDAQLDDLMKERLHLDFDPLDMPKGRFIVAGEAWQMCKQGKAKPEQFGIFQWHGWDFIRGNLHREILSFNRFEPLPWDDWGIMSTTSTADYTPAQNEQIEQAARMSAEADVEGMWALYQADPSLHAPDEWFN